MDVRNGYKQTEVGIIPEDWHVLPITSVTTNIFLGLTSKVDYVEQGGVPLVRATDIADGKLRFDDSRTISVNQHKKLTQYRQARRGDVLVSKSGSLGVCALVDTDIEFSIYESIIVIQPSSKLHSKFLLSLLRAEATQSRMIGGKVGSTVSHLNLGMFRDLEIQLPPSKNEQEAIAEALSDADALIESLEALLTKKRQLKQGAMSELLAGKRRLSLFSDEWEEVRFDEIITRFSTGLNPRSNFVLNDSGAYYYVTIKNFKDGYLFLDDNCDKIDEKALALINARSDLRKDDIIFASIGRVGDAYLITETPRNWNINESVFTLRPNQQRIVPLFLFHILTTNRLKKTLEKDATGSTFQSVKMADLRATLCMVPKSKAEQIVIAEILSDMDAEIATLEEKLVKARQVKQGMMQELLTGKIRLI